MGNIIDVVRGDNLKTSCSNGFESIKDSVIASKVNKTRTNIVTRHCEKCVAFCGNPERKKDIGLLQSLRSFVMTKNFVIASQRSWRGNLMTKPAFTLAEVLITLGIIGIVAALTIPALMQSTNNKELVSGTLKMNTTLSNALKNMEALDMVGVNKIADLETFDSNLRQQLKTVNCTDHSVCLSDGGYFDYGAPQFGGACDRTTPCLIINADVNGKKGPNKDGKDIYTFQVTSNGILPLGLTETCSGLDCTAYVLAHHKLWEGNKTESQSSELVIPSCSESATGTCQIKDGVLAYDIGDGVRISTASAGSYEPKGVANGTPPKPNYYNGAVTYCEDLGMRLPSRDEALAMYAKKSEYADVIPQSGQIWTTSGGPYGSVGYLDFSDEDDVNQSRTNYSYTNGDKTYMNIVCVNN